MKALISLSEQDMRELWNKAIIQQSTCITSNNPMLGFEKCFTGHGLELN